MRIAVVGGGIAGLAAAHRLSHLWPPWAPALRLVVLEADDQLGGHAKTTSEDGFIVEAGPNAFIHRPGTSKTLDLAKELGIDHKVVAANHSASHRFIARHNLLHPVPDSPRTMLTSQALSWPGKLRLAMEPFVRKAPRDLQETVYQFARRRIGAEAASVLVDTAVSGISAGDSHRLSASAAFPLMVAMEREHGSLVRAMVANRRTTSRSELLSFNGGMATLTNALGDRLGDTVRLNSAARNLEKIDGSWQLSLEDGGQVHADAVILALPAFGSARLVAGLDQELFGLLSSIDTAAMDVVAMAFKKSDLRWQSKGYGYLVTADSNMATLGVVGESEIFCGRADNDHTLIRIMMGGARRPDIAELSKEDLIALAQTELRQIVKPSAAPVRTWVRRWPRAIAQYTLGHSERVDRCRQLASRLGLVSLCGSSYDGIAFDAALSSGRRCAEALIDLVLNSAYQEP